jgi:hypothetical protein
MLITQITFFINCANALLNLHQAGTLLQKRQVETFLKTWFFYNSASQEIYWTGKTSVEVQNGAPAVAEHWYGNLSSVYYIMNPDVLNRNFFALEKRQQILEVFAFMQWNKTSQAENLRLRNLQRPEVFFDIFQGNPNLMYQEAGVVLSIEDEERNLLPVLEDFFNYPQLEDQNTFSIFEIGMKRGLTSFLNKLQESAQCFQLNIKYIKFGSIGCMYRIEPNPELTGRNSFANFYRITMTALWKQFRNNQEIESFLNTFNREIAENGPYRNVNTFDQTYGNYAFSIQLRTGSTIWLWTRYNDQERYKQMLELFEFFGATMNVYNSNIELRNLGCQIGE